MPDETNMTDTASSQEQTTTDVGGGDAAQSDTGADQAAGDASLLETAGTTNAQAGDGDGGTDADAADAAGEDDQGETDAQVPETYELKVTQKNEAGEDVDVEIDSVLLEKATPVLKDLGLTNEQANKVAALVPEVTNRILQQQTDNFAAMRADWAKTAKADKEIGGAKWAETETLAARALDTFGAPAGSEIRKLLTESGFGDHPEMIRMFRKIGETLGEDGGVPRGDGAKVTAKPREEVLYPNDVPKT